MQGKSEERDAWLAGLFGFGAERSERRCRVEDGAQAAVGLRWKNRIASADSLLDEERA